MSPAVSSALSLLSLALAVVAILLATIANRRWARRPSSPSPGAALGPESAVLRSELETLRNEVENLASRGDAGDPTALRHVALVRYDAFADVGGRLSYSVALLDDSDSGLVLTTLAGKTDVRTYVRTISAGTPDGSLTAEEQQAIDAAVGSRQ